MIIGIDLGTTNSLAAYYSENGPEIIPNRLGERLTPSVVSIDEKDQVYVGKTARERMALYPEQSASLFKRSMGSKKIFQLGNRKFTATDLSALVLRSLKKDAEAYLGEPVTEAVISVPAYFNEVKRKAVKQAGELAGLKVERIISEPTAAAIAYGLYQKKDNTRFLVFDLGGGTFDVSILELSEEILEVRAVAGDNYLGGEDFTKLILQEFYKEHHIDENELSSKDRAYFRNQAEKCKCHPQADAFYRMQAVVNGQKTETIIPRGAFEKMSANLLDRIKSPVRKSLSDAGVKAREIDEVVLVGGTTRMPLVRKFVSRLFGRVPDTSIHPDEAVALGAAIQAAMKERKEAVREVILTDVCPFTLGTEVSVKMENGHVESNHFCPIIERNTVIPASRTEKFFTVHDHQTKVEIHILQGESRFASNNVSLGTLELTVPDNEAGKEEIDITYTYDINALLEVEAKIVSTKETVTRLIKNQENNMTKEEMEARMKELAYLKIPPREQEKNKVLLLRGERLYEETTGELREQLEMVTEQFERILDRQNPQKIEEARKDYEDALEWIEEEMNYNL
ncbi:MAG: molecular chaperone HscC [Eubacterium sp.]|nr:molecular chaperone HscC [Eubacterium sp.]MDY5498064.1 molecular chaperone HscC [Anaerobutyricum sp.]